MGWELLLLISGLLFLLYKWATATFNTFKDRGLPYDEPWPLFGNMAPVFCGKVSFLKLIVDSYKRLRQHKIVGIFNLRTPMIQINDPEYIKKITVKDFEHFPNHQLLFKSEEPLIHDMLSVMKDQRWKKMRNTLSPVFTAAKMRSMFVLMNDSFSECLQHLDSLSTKKGDSIDVELKEVCNRLSNDLIATTAFGLKTNSFKDANNEFYKIGQSIVFFRGSQLWRFMLSATVPWLFKMLGFKIFDHDKTAYFVRLVVEAMKYREEHKIVRPDMIQLLMEAKKEASTDWTDEEIVAQCFIFFFAAFENNAVLICTTAHELVDNPDVQEKLYEECRQANEDLKGQSLSYDTVQNMEYMDMVISESLRKWSLAPSTDRVCTKDYTLHDDDGSVAFEFKVGDHINIPIIGLHWDERYFPNPEEFDPERFSKSQKDSLIPYTYLPFGVGPRNCIGNRYALMQAKAMLFNLLLKYKLERAPKTSKNLMTDSKGFTLRPKEGFWVKLVPRK